MNKFILKFFGTLGYMLAVLLIAIFIPEKYQTTTLFKCIFLILEFVGLVSLFGSFSDKDYVAYMKQHDEYMKKEENQITIGGIVKFDSILFVMGIIIFLLRKYAVDFFAGIGYGQFARHLNTILFAIVIFYFAVVFIAIFYTVMVIKENNTGR